MPARKKPEPAVDFDSLLEPSEAEQEVLIEMESEIAPAEVEETPEQRRIRELEAALAEPEPEPEVIELTPDQIRIAELEALLAEKQERIASNSAVQYGDAADDGERILIHFLEDGFMAFGNIWYRGQEVEVSVNSREYAATVRDGHSWLELRDDFGGQVERYGSHKFASGPFRPRKGEVFTDDVAAEDRRRGRRVPVVRT
jgi:hypothetical protein